MSPHGCPWVWIQASLISFEYQHINTSANTTIFTCLSFMIVLNFSRDPAHLQFIALCSISDDIMSFFIHVFFFKLFTEFLHGICPTLEYWTLLLLFFGEFYLCIKYCEGKECSVLKKRGNKMVQNWEMENFNVEVKEYYIT